MNTEQLRNMIENQRLEPYPFEPDWLDVHVKTTNVTDLIARTLSVEYNNACCAEDGLDYYFKAGDYVIKQYKALKAISNECWSDYISNVGLTVEKSTKIFIDSYSEYLEDDEQNRITYMNKIISNFNDFVFAFFTLQYIMNKKTQNDIDIEN